MAKRLEYDSLKAVLQYMNPNLRFQLAARCPRLTAVNEVLPLRISKLDIHHSFIKIDNATYRVGIIQQYHNGKTPNTVIQKNEGGGLHYDVDKYGLGKFIDEEDELERAQMLDKEISWIENEDIPLSTRQAYQLEDLKNRLLAHRLRITRMEPTYSMYLQLTIRINDVVCYEKFEYNKSIREAMDYLINRLLNGSRNPVEVNTLWLGSDIYLPEDFRKLKVRNLQTNDVISAARIIDYDNYPLKKLDLGMFDQDQPIIRSSQILVLNAVGQFPNHQRVHFKHFLSTTNIFDIVDRLRAAPQTPGAHYSFGSNSYNSDVGESEEEDLSEERNDQFEIFNLSDTTQLCMYFEKTDEKSKEFCDKKWMLHMKIQSRNGP